MSANKQKKQGIITEVTAKVQKAKGMVFVNYQGLTHHQLEAFKRKIKPYQAEFVVAKNTLLLRSLEEKNLGEEEKKNFQQPTATLFMYDEPIAPLKELANVIKELKLPTVKFGIVDGNVLNAAQVERLSSLPPLNVLRAQLLGQIKSPIAGLHRSLNWNIQKFVLTLNAVKEKKTV